MRLIRANIVDLMEFMVLGPLRVEEAGSRIPLGGPKQRTMLALLLAAPQRVVSMDELLMGVYGPDADPRARRSIQTWISDFRRYLDSTIERRGDGYVLDVDPLSIDAGRFEDGVRTAHQARHDELAAELLREALGLWRGRPYADVEPAPTLAAEARRLEELKAQALDARITFDLGAGKHRELVPELETLVAAHPHDESLRAHHMVALYRCGRQADALRAFRSAENLLREELGVDPSPDLQSLEGRILTQDHTLDYRPAQRIRPIPQRFTSFIGRSDELQTVRDLVRDNRLVTITGPGGVGKSSLGVEVARSMMDEFMTAFVPIEADREAEPWRILATCLGITAADDADLPQQIIEAVGNEPLLLLLDGCEHVLDQAADIVSRLLSRSSGLRILLTSREPLAMTGERVFGLGPLDHGEGSSASQLFVDRAGLDVDALDETEMRHISTIGSHVSGLPLGVELAAARTRGLRLGDIAARLDDQLDLLETKRGGAPHQRSMVATLEWSYRLLTAESRRHLRGLGVFPTGRLPVDAVARVLQIDSPSEALAPLVDASLVTPPEASSAAFGILEPVRQYAAHLLVESGEYDSLRLRHAEWVAELCEAAQEASLLGDLWRATDIISDHAPSIAVTAAWASGAGHAAIALRIVACVGRLWPRVADPMLLIGPGLAAMEAGEPADRGLWLRALARLAFLHTPHRADEARKLLHLLQEAAAREEMDLVTQHIVLGAIGSVRYRIGRGAEADAHEAERWLELQRRATSAAVAAGYPAEPHLYNRALVRRLAGDLDGERDDLERLLEWAGEERPMWRGMALHVLGKLQHLDGDPESGITSATEAARLLVDGGDLDFAAEAEYMLAGIYAAEERFDLAAEALERVNDYHRQIGLPPALVEDPDIVAEVAAGLGEWDVFLKAARAAFDGVPPDEDAPARDHFLRGEPGNTSSMARMIPAVARYLIAHGASDVARRVLAGMELCAGASPDPGVYQRLGRIAAVERLAAEAGGIATDDVPPSLEALFALMHGVVGRGEARDVTG